MLDKMNKDIDKATKLQEEMKDIESGKAIVNADGKIVGYNHDYMNDPEYSEFQNIVDEEFIKANKLNANDCVLKTILFVRKLAKKLNDEENHEFTERMKKWYNKVGI